MRLTDEERRIHALAEATALEEFVTGDQARMLMMWVITRLVRGMTKADLDIAAKLAESKKADAATQVKLDEVKRKTMLAQERAVSGPRH
jgi:hypothetical protein